MNSEQLGIIVVVVGLVVLVLWMARELFLWYTGVNRIVETQKKTNFILLKILENSGGRISEEERYWLGKD